MIAASAGADSTRPHFESPPPFPSREDFLSVVARAEEGNDDSLDHLQRLLDHFDTLWEPLELISRLIERHLFRIAVGESRLPPQRVERHIADFRDALLEGNDDPLDAFLIHRIVVSYLTVMIRTAHVAEDVDAGELRCRQRHLETAKRRRRKFLAAFREYRIIRGFDSASGDSDDAEFDEVEFD